MAKKDKYAHTDGYPRFYKADFELQKKIGTGPLDQGVVAKVQAYLDSAKPDVKPQLRLHLAEIVMMIGTIESTGMKETYIPIITRELMNIKSISGMFHEMMICRVSAFLLTFLEDARKFDRYVVEIVAAYTRVTKILLDMNIKEETNPHGQAFLTEIRNACRRYHGKQAIPMN